MAIGQAAIALEMRVTVSSLCGIFCAKFGRASVSVLAGCPGPLKFGLLEMIDRRSLLLMAGASFGCGLRRAGASSSVKRVFMVQSQERGHVCGQPQAEGILNAMAEAGWRDGDNLEMRFHYMDYYGKNATAELLHADGQRVLEQIEAFRPNLVVTLDDGAIKEVMMPLVGREDIALVFSGMNAEPDLYNSKKKFFDSWERPGSNATGVTEKLYTAESMRVMTKAIPGFSGGKIILATDMTVTGEALAKQFARELKEVRDIRWEIVRVKTFGDYMNYIAAANADPDVRAVYPLALTTEGPSGERITMPQIYDWTIANSKKPEMAANYYFARLGLFGGAVVNFRAMGIRVGRKAVAILEGQDPGEIPIEESPDFAIVFNIKRARELGIEIPLDVLTAADAVYRDNLVPLQGRPLIYDPSIESF